MMSLPRRAALCAPALLSLVQPAAAQGWVPSRPIRFIVTFPPGGSADALVRRLAEPLGRFFGQAVVVENRPGAGGAIGMEALARATPDGQVIAMGGTGPLVINPALPGARLPYDPATDFTPLILLAEQPNLLVTHPSVPAAPVSAFRQWLLAHPNEPFASPGSGTSNHATGLVYAAALGGRVQHVPYRGSAPAQVDLLAGNIRLQVDNIAGNVLPLIREGRMKVVAVSTASRSQLLPDVPSMTEDGAPPLASWQGIFAPRGLPAPIARRLNAALNAALRAPSVADWLRDQGADSIGGSAEEFAAFLAQERTKWARLVREHGITGE